LPNFFGKEIDGKSGLVQDYDKTLNQ